MINPSARLLVAFLARDSGKLTLAAAFGLVRGGRGVVGRLIERDAGGRPLRMSGTNTDITGHERHEQKLQRLNPRQSDQGVPGPGPHVAF